MKEEEDLSTAASLGKHYHRIIKKRPYSLYFIENGIVRGISSQESFLFLFVKNEEAIAKKFKQRNIGCIATAN